MAAERLHPSRACRPGDRAPSAPIPRERRGHRQPRGDGLPHSAVVEVRRRLGWPPPDITHEADRVDPTSHEAEIAAHLTFNYSVLDEQETERLRWGYIDPPSGGSPEGARRGGLVVGSRPARWQPSRTRARRVRPALAGADMALPRCPLHPPDAEPDRCQATRRHRHWMRALPSIWNTAEEIRTNTDGVLCVLAISRSSMCTLLRGPTRPASRAGLEYRRQVKHRTTTPSK